MRRLTHRDLIRRPTPCSRETVNAAMPTDPPPPTTSDDPAVKATDGYPGRAPRGQLARRLGSPGALVITLGSLALGLWLLVESSSEGFPATALHLLAGLVTVALPTVLATLGQQTRCLGRELSRPPIHDAAGAPKDQEPHP